MHTLIGSIDSIAQQLQQFPLPVARAVYSVLVARYGGSCTKQLMVELRPAGRSFGVDLRHLGSDLMGEPAFVFNSRWTIGPRGAVQRQQVGP